MECLAQGPVPGGLTPGGGEEGRALFGVEVEPVSGGVMKAHFGHSEQNTRILFIMESRMSALPCRFAGPGAETAAEVLTLLAIVLNQAPRGSDRAPQQGPSITGRKETKRHVRRSGRITLGPKTQENALSPTKILPEFLTFAPRPCSSTLDFGPGRRQAIRHLRPASVGVTILRVLRHPAKKLPQVLIFGVF